MPNISRNISSGGVTFTGAVTATRFVTAAGGTAALPAFDVNGAGGIYSDAGSTLRTAAGGAQSTTHTAGLVAFNGNAAVNAMVAASLRTSPASAVSITGVGSTVPFTSTNQPITATGVTVLTSAPTITGGSAGDMLVITNTSANAVTFSDKGTLPSSGLTLSAATIVLAQNDTLFLLCTAANNWTQVATSNNV